MAFSLAWLLPLTARLLSSAPNVRFDLEHFADWTTAMTVLSRIAIGHFHPQSAVQDA